MSRPKTARPYTRSPECATRPASRWRSVRRPTLDPFITATGFDTGGRVVCERARGGACEPQRWYLSTVARACCQDPRGRELGDIDVRALEGRPEVAFRKLE